MTIQNKHLKQLQDAFKDLKTGTGERGQFRAFLGKGDGQGTITNAVPPTYREVWYHTGNQSGSQSAGQQIHSAPLSWLAALVIPYVNDPQFENLPIVVGYPPGSDQLEVLRPDGLGAAAMLRNPGLYSRENWYVQPPGTSQGRLTSTSGQAFGDSASFTNILFTPYQGNLIGSFNGHTWRVKSFTEQSLAIPNNANQNYDIFWDDPTATIVALGWSSNTARATGLVQQDGIWVLSGTTSRRYLGTIRTTSAGHSADTISQRYIWNFYNRLPRPVRIIDGTANYTYTTASWRQVNANAANKVEVVCGFASDEVMIDLQVHHLFTASGAATCYSGIGVDQTTSINQPPQVGGTGILTAGNFTIITASYDDAVPLGYHAFNWNELGAAGVTFYAAGLSGGVSGHYWS